MQYKTVITITIIVLVILLLGFVYLQYGDDLLNNLKNNHQESSEMQNAENQNMDYNDYEMNSGYGSDYNNQNYMVEEPVWNSIEETYNQPYEERDFTESEYK
jgi:predicted metalloprotease